MRPAAFDFVVRAGCELSAVQTAPDERIERMALLQEVLAQIEILRRVLERFVTAFDQSGVASPRRLRSRSRSRSRRRNTAARREAEARAELPETVSNDRAEMEEVVGFLETVIAEMPDEFPEAVVVPE